jgi:hypothetical protein
VKLPQHIPAIINGNIIHGTKNRKGLYYKSSPNNNCKLSDVITSNIIQCNELNKGSKVVMIGDGHFRDCAENVKSYLQNTYEINSVVKPGALINDLIDLAKKDIKRLTFDDTVIFCGGTNDMGKTNISSLLNSIIDFICCNNHTNI